MGTCRGWRREGWGTMGRQLLQLLGRAVILPAESRRALAGRRGELQRISHPPTFWKRLAAPVGFRQLLVYRLFPIIVHSGRGQLTFDPPLLCPAESLLGQTVGKWQGCITSKINVGKYGSDASSFTSRLLNSHSLLLRPAWGGERGREGEGKPQD